MAIFSSALSMIMTLLALKINATSTGFLSFFGNNGDTSSNSLDSSEDGPITMNTIKQLRDELRPIIDNTALGNSGIPNWDRFPEDRHPLIAGLIRLAFHDCAEFIQLQDGSRSDETGCDGCIQLPSNANRGPNESLTLIEPLYNETFKYIMSRADFWALSAMVAAEYGAELAMEARNELRGKGLLSGDNETESGFKFESFYYGRVDCPGSPYYNGTGFLVRELLPQDEFTREDTKAFFGDKYGFNTRETIAIMGAHTLGRSRGGFGAGAWTPDGRQDQGIASRPDTLDNQYYIDIVDGDDDGSPCKPIPDPHVTWRSIQLNTRGPEEFSGRRIYVHDFDYNELISEQFPNGLNKTTRDERTNASTLMFVAELALYYDLFNLTTDPIVIECFDADGDDGDKLSFFQGTLPDGHDVQDCRVIPFEIDSDECDSSSSSDSSEDDDDDDGYGPTAKYVRLYAMDNALWLREFADVLTTVISIPLNSLTELENDECD